MSVGAAGRVEAATIFADNFDAGLTWTVAGTGTASAFAGTPHNGTYSVELTRSARIERTISTVGYQNVTVSFSIGKYRLEQADYFHALWYDGSAWQELARLIPTDVPDQALIPYSISLGAIPAATNNPNFALRFEMVGNQTNDFGYVDDVLVEGDRVYTLNLAKVGSGQVRVNGTLRSLPWSGTFTSGSVVNLVAVPDACQQFDNWSGDLTGTAGSTSITMNADKAVTANFSTIQYTLTLTGAGTGQVRVNGTLRSLPWIETFACGSVVNLVAVPGACQQFDNWSGDLTGTAASTSITMNGNRAVTANFSLAQYTLSLTGTGTGQVRVNGTLRSLPWIETFACGSVVNLVAVPGACQQFDNWTGDLGGTAASTSITMDANKAVTANFSTIQYTLTLTGAGTGQVRVNGTLRSLPWIETFACDSVVNLVAVPGSCQQFDNWSGDLTGTAASTSITMNGNKAVTANFSTTPYTLTLTGTGSGQVRVNGTLRSLPWIETFACDSVVNLVAVPGSCQQFDNWSGDLTGTAASTSITMNGNKAVTANFSLAQYTLTLTGVGTGQVRVNGTLRALPWIETFSCGSVVNLVAVPGSCQQFDNWTGDLTGTAASTSITINGNKAVTASFSLAQYTLTLTGTGSGQVRVNGTLRSLPWIETFPCGSVANLTAVPSSGWGFAGWTGDLTWSGATVAVTMDANKAITANFSVQPTLTINKNGSGSATVGGVLRSLPWTESFPTGTPVILEAVPDAGWTFDGWTGAVTWSGTQITVTMDASKSVTANFSPDGFVLTIARVGSGSAIVDGTPRTLPWSGSFSSGASVELQAVPDSGWQFDGWSGDVSWTGSTVFVTMDGDKNVTASFSALSISTLSLEKSGEGAVRVDGTLRTLPWSDTYAQGTEVTLEAVPEAGWFFAGWSGGASGSANPITVTLDVSLTITATFTQVLHAVELSAVGNGSVEVNGSPVALPYSGSVPAGGTVTLEAVPASGWRFVGWSGDATGTDNPIVVSVDGDLSIGATFVLPDTYFLTIGKVGSGSVSVDGEIVSLPWTGEFARNADVVLAAVIEGEQEFYGWSGDVVGTDLSVTVAMDDDKTVLAEFMCIATFTDVPCDHWAADAIEAVHEADIARGYPDGTYLPDLAVTRCAMAVFIARSLSGGGDTTPAGPSDPTFGDVPVDHWAYDCVEYIVDNSVVEGYGDGSYQPAWQVNRAQLAVFVARSIVTPTGEAGLEPYEAPEEPTFSDVPTSFWSYKHIEYLAENGIVEGYPDGLYRPAAVVTRDQMAVYLSRAFDLF